ncbi:hypothetical protein F4809DRAFT_487214 [Biscogniauxia mediterranea]|nr:hypothetical protein F4809DRAFT_487214 [Biscogniauxia mediterranea]
MEVATASREAINYAEVVPHVVPVNRFNTPSSLLPIVLARSAPLFNIPFLPRLIFGHTFLSLSISLLIFALNALGDRKSWRKRRDGQSKQGEEEQFVNCYWADVCKNWVIGLAAGLEAEDRTVLHSRPLSFSFFLFSFFPLHYSLPALVVLFGSLE